MFWAVVCYAIDKQNQSSQSKVCVGFESRLSTKYAMCPWDSEGRVPCLTPVGYPSLLLHEGEAYAAFGQLHDNKHHITGLGSQRHYDPVDAGG